MLLQSAASSGVVGHAAHEEHTENTEQLPSRTRLTRPPPRYVLFILSREIQISQGYS